MLQIDGMLKNIMNNDIKGLALIDNIENYCESCELVQTQECIECVLSARLAQIKLETA